MAGIGFELKKVIQKGNMGSFLKAALSGTMIVAGPWIISICTIITITRIADFAFLDAPQLFIAIIVYTYSFSIIFFGGFHYIYTRLIADLIFMKQGEKAASLLLFFSLAVAFVSTLVAFVASFFINPPIEHILLLKVSLVLLFASVNVIWILMLFISLVSWYGRIFLTYLAGMATAVVAVYFLGKELGTAGALLGFAVGHLIIVFLLFLLAFRAIKPAGFFSGTDLIMPYTKRYRSLFLTGYLYHIGLWIDKIIFWALYGTPIAGTFFKVYEPYDIAVYLATLTMIPGLVFFTIFSEPSFYIYVKKFLLSLSTSNLRSIQHKKYLMFRKMKENLLDQTLFQSVITLCCLILVPVFIHLFPGILVSRVMILTLSAVFFHLLLLTSINLHFYLEYYRYTFRAALLFMVLNTLGTLGIVYLDIANLAGLNYLIATGVSALYSLSALFREGINADRYILSGAKIM